MSVEKICKFVKNCEVLKSPQRAIERYAQIVGKLHCFDGSYESCRKYQLKIKSCDQGENIR